MVQRHCRRPNGFVFSSPGLYEQYPDNVVGRDGAVNVNAIVRLRSGAAGIDEFEQEFTRVTGIENADFQDLYDDAQHTRDVTAFEARVLLLLALMALLASMVLIGVAISRYCAASFADLEVLRAFGLTPAQSRLRRRHRPASAAVVGALLGSVAAWWMSRGSRSAPPRSSNRRPERRSIRWCCSRRRSSFRCSSSRSRLLSLRSAHRVGQPTGRVSFVEATTATWPLTLGIGTRFALSGRSTRNSASGTSAGRRRPRHRRRRRRTDLRSRHRRRHRRLRTVRTDLRTRRLLGIGGQDFVDAAAALATIAADPDVDGVIDAPNDVANTRQRFRLAVRLPTGR